LMCFFADVNDQTFLWLMLHRIISYKLRISSHQLQCASHCYGCHSKTATGFLSLAHYA